MCGISFAVASTPDASLIPLVERMHATIRHRGPDGEGFLSGDHFAAAFRRLKILDPTDAGSQPMKSPSRPVAILMNGEIYNFKDLRREIEADGRKFQSSGDTEVALAAYERWGVDAFRRFEGMWAIVIVDLERRSIVISRDRFGIKPLFWAIHEGTLLLASECRQITAIAPPSVDDATLAMFLAGQRVPMLERTFFRGIRSVPPATYAEVSFDSAGAPRFVEYWSHASFAANGTPRGYGDAVERLDELLRDAVRTHLQSDVPVGALLSGGIDSSTIAVMLSEIGARVPTYSFGFRDRAPEVCEMPYVDAVLRERRLENFETSFTPEWIRDNAANVVRALEEPILALPPLAQYRILEFCREQGRTVMFDGQGADEIFGGYMYHQTTYLRDLWRGGRFGELFRESRAIRKATGQRMLPSLARAAASSRVRSMFRVRPANRVQWMSGEYAAITDPEMQFAIDDRGTDSGLVNRQIHFDLRWGNAKTILAFGDRNGMAHSIEVRVPFFDRRIVELALTTPDDFKVRNGDRKRILRDVARRRLPAVITERKDRLGFGVPERRWFRRDLWPFIKPVVREIDDGRFDKPRLDRFISDFDEGRSDDSRAIWRLYTFALWQREFAVAL